MPPGLVVASNRGPVAFRAAGDGIVGVRGVGGLVTAVTAALRDEDAAWIAVALGELDRRRVATGEPIRDGHIEVQLEVVSDELLAGYYREASNRAIWFAAHGSGARTVPAASWDAYRIVNERIAQRIAAAADPGAVVLVHDYHLCLVPGLLRAQRPDLAVSFFWHVPFPDADGWWTLGDGVARELLAGIAAADVVGVHAHRWADGVAGCMERTGLDARISILPLGIDDEALRAAAHEPEVTDRLRALERFGDRTLIARSDRIEPAKAIGDGLEAYALVLERRPELRGRVVQLIRATTSREDVEEYRLERERLEEQVRALNDRFGDATWQPVELVVEDDLRASLAAFRRYDVLLVTSRADGMNLVAREGPAVNERDGVLVLSRGAGAADAYADDGALLVEPGDVASIADALEEAITMPVDRRRALAAAGRMRASGTSPGAWLEQQRALAIDARAQRLAGTR